MNIVNFFSGSIQPAFGENFISSLTKQQKTIITIALAIFSCAFVGYCIYKRYFTAKIENVNGNGPIPAPINAPKLTKTEIMDLAKAKFENHPGKEEILGLIESECPSENQKEISLEENGLFTMHHPEQEGVYKNTCAFFEELGYKVEWITLE